MRSNGWCPSEVGQIGRRSGYFAMEHYTSKMKRPVEFGSHETCTTIKCLSAQNDLEAYRIAHTSDGCQCSMIGSSNRDLETAFASEADSYPVIRIVGQGPPMINVVTANACTPYLAISHIWADGLRNPNANEMPQCQLLYLNDIVKSLRQRLLQEEPSSKVFDSLIFIDTLTFPTRSSDVKLKAAALAKMGTIYQNATCVLVLDRTLTAYRYEDIGVHEALVRICTSRWSNRLWTLQEGSLARALWVQFKDQAVNLDELLTAVMEGAEQFDRHAVLSMSLLSEFYCLRSFQDPEQESILNHPLSSIWRGVWSRNCTVATDEALCISTLLNLDIEAVANSPPEERMQTMWKSMSCSPRGIPSQIITHKGPRVNAAGFCWAPSSLLRASGCLSRVENIYSDLSYTVGKVLPDGLLVEFPGFRLGFATAHFLASVQFPNLTNKSTDLLLFRNPIGIWYDVGVLSKFSRTTDTLGEIVSRHPSYALVLASGNDCWGIQAGQKETKLGVCGPCQQPNSDGQIVINTEWIVSVVQKSPGEQRAFETAYSFAESIFQQASILGSPKLGHNDIPDVDGPGNEEYAARLSELIVTQIETDMSTDPELARLVTTECLEGLPGFLLEVSRMLLGDYGTMVEEYPSTQQWIVD